VTSFDCVGPSSRLLRPGSPRTRPLLLLPGESRIVLARSILRHRESSRGSNVRAPALSSAELADVIYRGELDSLPPDQSSASP